MPLSEHEQRLLEQMERALYAEDPKFATSLRGADLRAHYRRRALKGVAAFALGVVLLMAGVISKQIVVGVIGFVVMLAAALFAISSWKHMPGEGDVVRPAQAPSSGRKPRFMDRVEDRWRRRRENGGR